MLAMLAHKRSWQRRREAEGQPTDGPNMVMGADVHTCWEKFARYFEVEPRVVPMQEDRYTIGAERGRAAARRAHDRRRRPARHDLHRPDGRPRLDRRAAGRASSQSRAGGSRCTSTPPPAASSSPFCEPELRWDFRLARVRSINVSNHKFGLVYPGMGTVVFREEQRPARGARVPHQLPRRRHAQLLAELLAAVELGDPAVLQLPAPGARGLPRRSSPACWPTRGRWPASSARSTA